MPTVPIGSVSWGRSSDWISPSNKYPKSKLSNIDLANFYPNSLPLYLSNLKLYPIATFLYLYENSQILPQAKIAGSVV